MCTQNSFGLGVWWLWWRNCFGYGSPCADGSFYEKPTVKGLWLAGVSGMMCFAFLRQRVLKTVCREQLLYQVVMETFGEMSDAPVEDAACKGAQSNSPQSLQETKDTKSLACCLYNCSGLAELHAVVCVPRSLKETAHVTSEPLKELCLATQSWVIGSFPSSTIVCSSESSESSY